MRTTSASIPRRLDRPVAPFWPRFRALFLLSLFMVDQASCTSWQVPKVTPQEYVTQHPDKKVRVTAKDEQGGWNTKAGVVLTGVRFAGDSVLGRDRKRQPFALSLQQVGAIEVRGKNGVLTGLLVVAMVPLVLFGVLMVVCASQGGTCIGY